MECSKCKKPMRDNGYGSYETPNAPLCADCVGSGDNHFQFRIPRPPKLRLRSGRRGTGKRS
jgi:hypothetical protein